MIYEIFLFVLVEFQMFFALRSLSVNDTLYPGLDLVVNNCNRVDYTLYPSLVVNDTLYPGLDLVAMTVTEWTTHCTRDWQKWSTTMCRYQPVTVCMFHINGEFDLLLEICCR